MGTRCVIRVEGFDGVELYKHWDGYPDSTLPWLEKFNQDFAKNRGDDPNYKFAQLLRSSARDAKEFNLDDSKYTGWGVFLKDEVGGIEYVYILHADGRVTWEKV